MDEENKDQTTDVNNADATTANESSNVEETATETKSETLADGTPVDQKTIPYKVFQETREELGMTKNELKELRDKMNQIEQATVKSNLPNKDEDPRVTEAKEQLKNFLKEVAPELGFVSKDELRRQEEDKAFDAQLDRLEKEWDGSKDPSLKFDRKEVIKFAYENGIANPEAAFKIMKEEALTNYRIKQALSKSSGIKTEGSNGSGSQQAGVTDDDLRTAAAKGDKKAHYAYLQRILKSADK